MKTSIFISWSGDYAGEVALALKDFIETCIQSTAPWISKEQDAGVVWFEGISKRLEAQIGVLCVTDANKSSRWLNFEAGALFGARKDQQRVIPYCIDLDVGALGQPLEQLNAAAADEKGTRKLLESINNVLGDARLADHVLASMFRRCWPDMAKALEKARNEEAERRGKAVARRQPSQEEQFDRLAVRLDQVHRAIRVLTQEVMLHGAGARPMIDIPAVEEDPEGVVRSARARSIAEVAHSVYGAGSLDVLRGLSTIPHPLETLLSDAAILARFGDAAVSRDDTEPDPP